MRTIFAQATARGKSGVAVIRISGPEAFEIGKRLCSELPEAGRSAVRRVRGSDGALLDEALVLRFVGPNSFTGEDIVELHLHGSPAVLRRVTREIQDLGLARLADAGEFTQRALLNNKLDLSQVEGLGDLLAAETEAQRLQAMRGFSGALAERSVYWRGLLLRAAALLEATIDFADEEVPVDVKPEVQSLVQEFHSDLENEMAGQRVAERLRDGFEVAILGAPNAGKSTLLNFLAKREVALTSDIPGTTRDIVELRYDLNGLPVTFLDTAGLRLSDDHVEKLGIARAVDRAISADFRMVLRTDDWECPDELKDKVDLELLAKDDAGGVGSISGMTGLGVDEALSFIQVHLEEKIAIVGVLSTERQRECMLTAQRHLGDALNSIESDLGEEIVAEHLRATANAVDSLVGGMDTEAILGEIFAQFCIGK